MWIIGTQDTEGRACGIPVEKGVTVLGLLPLPLRNLACAPQSTGSEPCSPGG